MNDRNYIAEMSAIIDAVTQVGELVVPLVAEDIVEKLRTNDPELLRGWLEARAAETLSAFIRNRLNSQRSYARSMHNRSVFANAAAEFAETGDVGAFAIFDTLVTVGPDNLRRRFGDLTSEDCTFVSNEYAKSRRESEMYEKFYSALSKKLNGRMVREVYTEDQCVAMLGSFRSA